MNAGLAAFQESPAAYQVAVESGVKSGIARRANAVKLRQLADLLPKILPNVQQRLEIAESQNSDHVDAMNTIQKQIARIDSLIEKEDTAKGMQLLCTGKARLFEIWAHLAGIPKPMAAREVRTTRRVIQAPAAPIELPPA